MSTIYDFDEKNAFESIETHYFNDGWDVEGLMENGDVIIMSAGDDFSDDYINNVEDVFMGKMTTYIVANVPEDDTNTVFLEVHEMSTEDFKANWSEKIWAKFRKDSYTHICPVCGEKMVYSVAGQTLSDIGRIEQFHCDNCHHTYVGHPNGEFIRHGVLHSSWDVR